MERRDRGGSDRCPNDYDEDDDNEREKGIEVVD
jgi:hypothetical protein